MNRLLSLLSSSFTEGKARRQILLATRYSLLATFFLLPSAPAADTGNSSLTPPKTLAAEARTFIQLLENAHYNRANTHIATYTDLVQDYMSALDGQRLFFTQLEKNAFDKRYSPDFIYWNLSGLGRIDAAYTIYGTFEKNIQARVAWIHKQLEKDINLATDDTYLLDRSKAPWPADDAAADTLWTRRLELEIIKELLNKKDLAAAKKAVAKRYDALLRNLSDNTSEDISETFLTTIARIYDDHSNYYSPASFAEFTSDMNLKLVGIGAVLSMEDDYCVIKEIMPGGPADLDKRLKPNDKILAVAQDKKEPVDVIGMRLTKVVRMIRGDKGTKVRLIVEPASNPSERKEIILTRDIINIESARAYGATFDVPSADGASTLKLGVIALPRFYGLSNSPDKNSDKENSATEDIAKLIKLLKKENIQGLVLDLRNNGGGSLAEAISITGLFIKKGPVVQVRASTGQTQVQSDDDPSVAYSGPLVVLTNRLSASASEIVAGALQNYGRAIIIGDPSTHGKGTVQTIAELKNLNPQLAFSSSKIGAAKFTIQKFYLPNGASTQLKGVIPDIVLPTINTLIPMGESDTPHHLSWDEIPSSIFDGRPLGNSTLDPLRKASQDRINTLPEFDLLKRRIEFFKKNYDEKSLSLNLEKRKKQKLGDRATTNDFNLERKKLSANDYPFNEVLLAELPKKPAKAKPTEEDDDELGDNYDELFPDENERHPALDIPMRESLRVLADLIAMKPQTENNTESATAPAPLKPRRQR